MLSKLPESLSLIKCDANGVLAHKLCISKMLNYLFQEHPIVFKNVHKSSCFFLSSLLEQDIFEKYAIFLLAPCH